MMLCFNFLDVMTRILQSFLHLFIPFLNHYKIMNGLDTLDPFYTSLLLLAGHAFLFSLFTSFPLLAILFLHLCFKQPLANND